MARLPTVGGDTGTWGTVLNSHLTASIQKHSLASSTAVGDSSITLDVAPAAPQNALKLVAIAPYTTNCEIRRVASIVGATVNLTAAATVAGTNISFASGPKTITRTGSTLGGFFVGAKLKVSGSASNNGTFTIVSVSSDWNTITVSETIVTESAGATVTLRVDLNKAHSAGDVVLFLQDGTIYAEMFGAKFDNSTDDTAALQAAIDNAALGRYGITNAADLPANEVVMPSGYTKLTSSLKMRSNMILRGAGSGSTILSNQASSGHTIELATGPEVQVILRDFLISIQNNAVTGIFLAQAGFASVLGDAAHVIENIIVVGGAKAFAVSSANELRVNNFLAYRQTPPLEDAAFYLASTDSMIERVTVAQVQYIGTGIGGAAIRAQTSNSRFVDIKVFGGSAVTSGQQQPAFYLVGQRNLIIGFEVQDYPGAWALWEDQGNNTYDDIIVDSCQVGGIRLNESQPSRVTNALFVNRGGAFTMPECIWCQNNMGHVVQGRTESVASVFSGGQTGVGNFVAINNPLYGGVFALTYGTTVNTDAWKGNQFLITATNGTAFTIANPTNSQMGQRITYTIKNSSGGAMGSITWGTAFKLAGAFTNPADTKVRTIEFYYDGTNWLELNRAAADI